MNYSTEKTFKIGELEITAYKVTHDTNGNPRWVVHFLDLLTGEEQAQIRDNAAPFKSVESLHNAALAKARKAHGQKYRAKWFGGGIVFQSYYIESDLKAVIA